MEDQRTLEQCTSAGPSRRLSRLALIGAAMAIALTTFAMPCALAQANEKDASADTIRQYAIIHGDNESVSGTWDTAEEAKIKGLRARWGEDFAWFRHSGSEYVITDSGVLKELDAAMGPQRKVNRMQKDVNALQGRVNDLQAKVNAHQKVVNASQQEVNRAGSEAQQTSQAAVNRQQAEVNREQGNVNAEQAKVNARQEEVNDEQRRATAEVQRNVQEVFLRSLQRGSARRVGSAE